LGSYVGRLVLPLSKLEWLAPLYGQSDRLDNHKKSSGPGGCLAKWHNVVPYRDSMSVPFRFLLSPLHLIMYIHTLIRIKPSSNKR